MLRRLARPKAQEVCEFCSLPLHPGHRHLLEAGNRKIICACDPCALRFENVVGRWRLIPRDSELLSRFQITDAQWDSLALPIQLAFFFQSTSAGKILAMYPSPAGATESLLPVESWRALEVDNPVLRELQPDVQALLANRLKQPGEYYLAPIDLCYELVGLIRLHWRGFSGGDRVWEELNGFFSRLRQQAVGGPQGTLEIGHA